MTSRTYQVKELAALARVSVRTLHHYDEIGLLVPSRRSAAGYRLYSDADVLRLQQILIGRELGLALEQIRRSLDDPHFDQRRALTEQLAELRRSAAQTADMIRSVERALELLDAKPEGDTMDMKQLFDGFDPDEHAEEAEQRWGHTDAYKESMRRTQRYTEQDWRALKEEQAAIYGDAQALLAAGSAPDGAAAMDLAERHRASIERWFYPCDHQMHRGLAQLYESDARFAANIDKFGAGLTTFLSAAIRANATRHGA